MDEEFVGLKLHPGSSVGFFSLDLCMYTTKDNLISSSVHIIGLVHIKKLSPRLGGPTQTSFGSWHFIERLQI